MPTSGDLLECVEDLSNCPLESVIELDQILLFLNFKHSLPLIELSIRVLLICENVTRNRGRGCMGMSSKTCHHPLISCQNKPICKYQVVKIFLKNIKHSKIAACF